MAGHVFIVRADIRRLACAAWLMPGSHRARLNEKWLPPGMPAPERPTSPKGWGNDGCRVLRVDTWPAGRPQPWLVNVGGMSSTPIAWYVDGVRQFLEQACQDVAGRPRLFDRPKALLAVPY